MDAGMVDDKVVDMMVDMADVDDMNYNSIVLRNKNQNKNNTNFSL